MLNESMPGAPKKRSGCFMAIKLSIDAMMLRPCWTGWWVEVLMPLYLQNMGASTMFSFFSAALRSISVLTDIPVSSISSSSMALREYALKPLWASLSFRLPVALRVR